MRAYVATAHRLIDFLGALSRRSRSAGPRCSASRPRICAPSSPSAAARGSAPRRLRASCRAFAPSCDYAAEQAGQACAAAAHARAQAAAHLAASGRARGSDGARRGCRRGRERAMDRRARSRDPAAALRRRAARRRGAVADRRGRCRSGATLRVTGKRSKTRIVPVVPAVREAIDDYVRQCPYPLTGDVPLFVGARGGPLNPDLVRRSVAAARRRLGLPDTPDAACAAPQLRDPFAGARAPTCARCRSCSATPACRRRKFIPRWTRRVCSTFIATPIPAPEQRPERRDCRGAPVSGETGAPRQ